MTYIPVGRYGGAAETSVRATFMWVDREIIRLTFELCISRESKQYDHGLFRLDFCTGNRS